MSWPSSVRKNELSGKGNCLYRQRSLSESDADSKEYGEAGHKPKVSFVVENDSDVHSTSYTNMKHNRQKKAKHKNPRMDNASPVANENKDGFVTVRSSDNQGVLKLTEKNDNIKYDTQSKLNDNGISNQVLAFSKKLAAFSFCHCA